MTNVITYICLWCLHYSTMVMVTRVTTITGEPFLLAIRYIYVNDLPSTTAMYLLLLLLLYI